MTLRLVTLDLWNTLIFDPPAVAESRADVRYRALASALAAIGWPVEPAHIDAALESTGRQHGQIQLAGRDLSIEDQVVLFLSHLAPDRLPNLKPAQLTAVVRVYGRAALVAPPLLAEGAAEVLRRLRDAGLGLALISNTGRTPGRVLREVLQDLDIHDFFDTLVFSDEVELAKPSPAIFHMVLDALGVAPREAVHVGDDPRLDLAGARDAGMSAVIVSHTCPPDLPASARWIPRLADLPDILQLRTSR
jgi:putative hydrolase of the HAD superfamily